MPKRKGPVKLTFRRIAPVLEPEERARRIEEFVDTLEHVFGVEGYLGCKYITEENIVEIYTRSS